MCHVTEHGEYNEPGQETGEKVYRTGQYGVPITVVVELVVAGQGEKRAESWAQREEDLRRRVYPYLVDKKFLKNTSDDKMKDENEKK